MLTDTALPGNRDAENLPEAADFLERHFTMAEQELLDMRWPSRQLTTADVQAHAIKHNFALATWRKKNACKHWVLVCERRLKRGVICPEVLCKAQARLAKSTSKNHSEYPYSIRKNETVFQHGQCSGAAISKGCHGERSTASWRVKYAPCLPIQYG